MIAIVLTVNGDRHDLEVEPRRLLSDVLRHDLGLTGTHVGCEHGVCGCCTVLLDDEPVRACLVLAVQTDGRAVSTVEGLARADGTLLGYNWLKREGDEVEIYVVGVAPQAAGRGLGRALMQAGLERMHATGAERTSLYVEGDNDAALSLYRSLGYEQLSIDVQYRRTRS